MTREDIGDEIARRRKSAGLSMKELGDMIGRDIHVVNEYESGEVDIQITDMIKIAKALNTDVSGLLREKGASERELVTELRIYHLEDRLTVAQILIKNGYTVSQVKRSNGDNKTVQYRLKIEDCIDNLRIVK